MDSRSPEHKTLFQYYPKIVSCIQQSPVGVAVQLKPSGILSSGDWDFLTGQANTNVLKAIKIVDVVLNQTQNNPQVFHTFVSALEAAGYWTETTVNELKQTQISLSANMDEHWPMASHQDDASNGSSHRDNMSKAPSSSHTESSLPQPGSPADTRTRHSGATNTSLQSQLAVDAQIEDDDQYFSCGEDTSYSASNYLTASEHSRPVTTLVTSLDARTPRLHFKDYQKVNAELIIYKKQKIGEGAFGAVFKGSYKGALCAVKVLHHLAIELTMDLPSGEGQNKVVKEFTNECDFLKSFQHPNIVQFWSTEKHPSGNILLVTELMDCNLRSYLTGYGEECLSSDCQNSISKDVASGLAYIHSRKTIHRDLCGDNILLSVTLGRAIPIAKISDFGKSRLLTQSRQGSTLTAIGHRMGYLPPEAHRLEEEQYDCSLDVFSLGVVMMQIICMLDTVESAKDRSIHRAKIPDTHKLKPLINVCLDENMQKRPTAHQVYAILAGELTVEGIVDKFPKTPGLSISVHEPVSGFHDGRSKDRKRPMNSNVEIDAKRPKTTHLSDDITLSDHQGVYERLVGVSVQWRELGGALGLDQDTLSAIDTKHRGDVQVCLREMLTKRLQSGGPLSWRVLCDCLRSPTVRRDDVAEEIEQELGELTMEEGVPKTAVDATPTKQAHETITLEKLAELYNISHDQLDSEIDDRDIIFLAQHFDDVEYYFGPLQLSSGEQFDATRKQFSQGTHLAMNHCLRLWKRRNPSTAILRKLLNILLALNKEEIASNVCKQFSQNRSSYM